MSDLFIGTAKLSITPKPEMLPLPQKFHTKYTEVHDDIFVRVLLLENNNNKYIFVEFDLFGVPDTADLKAMIAEELSICSENIILFDSYNHCSPRQDIDTFAIDHCSNAEVNTKKYFEFCITETLSAVRQAGNKMVKGRIGVGAGKSYANVYREVKIGDIWSEDVDFEGPSDKELLLLRFEDMNGNPLAFLMNYTLYGNMAYIVREAGSDDITISGDIPGMTQRFLEQSFDDSVIVLWASGAAGDQNPLVMGSVPVFHPDGSRSSAILAPAPAYLYCSSLAGRIAADALMINQNIYIEKEAAEISAAEIITVLPGQTFHDEKDQPQKAAGPDINLRLQALRIGNILLYAVSCAPGSALGTRLKEDSPYKYTFLITHAGENSGYIADDLGCMRKTINYYRMKIHEGDAEPALRSGLRKLMDILNQ